MRTLDNHTLLYDDECPACSKYTQVFVNTKMIDERGRQPYSKLIGQFKAIDPVRASNEIAMINHNTGAVTYGVESLFRIFEYNFPFLTPVFRNRFFHWLMMKLYFFISYNRKAIVPGNEFEGCNRCVPTLNYTYRWAYIGFAWLITSWVLVYFAQLLVPLIPPTNFIREFIICGGQIVFQSVVVGLFNRQRVIYYLGNLMTVSLGGALLLLPAFLIPYVTDSVMVNGAYFFAVVLLMLLEHIRRVKILALPWVVSVTWVVYRIIVLLIIL